MTSTPIQTRSRGGEMRRPKAAPQRTGPMRMPQPVRAGFLQLLRIGFVEAFGQAVENAR